MLVRVSLHIFLIFFTTTSSWSANQLMNTVSAFAQGAYRTLAHQVGQEGVHHTVESRLQSREVAKKACEEVPRPVVLPPQESNLSAISSTPGCELSSVESSTAGVDELERQILREINCPKPPEFDLSTPETLSYCQCLNRINYEPGKDIARPLSQETFERLKSIDPRQERISRIMELYRSQILSPFYKKNNRLAENQRKPLPVACELGALDKSIADLGAIGENGLCSKENCNPDNAQNLMTGAIKQLLDFQDDYPLSELVSYLSNSAQDRSPFVMGGTRRSTRNFSCFRANGSVDLFALMPLEQDKLQSLKGYLSSSVESLKESLNALGDCSQVENLNFLSNNHRRFSRSTPELQLMLRLNSSLFETFRPEHFIGARQMIPQRCEEIKRALQAGLVFYQDVLPTTQDPYARNRLDKLDQAWQRFNQEATAPVSSFSDSEYAAVGEQCEKVLHDISLITCSKDAVNLANRRQAYFFLRSVARHDRDKKKVPGVDFSRCLTGLDQPHCQALDRLICQPLGKEGSGSLLTNHLQFLNQNHQRIATSSGREIHRVPPYTGDFSEEDFEQRRFQASENYCGQFESALEAHPLCRNKSPQEKMQCFAVNFYGRCQENEDCNEIRKRADKNFNEALNLYSNMISRTQSHLSPEIRAFIAEAIKAHAQSSQPQGAVLGEIEQARIAGDRSRIVAQTSRNITSDMMAGDPSEVRRRVRVAVSSSSEISKITTPAPISMPLVPSLSSYLSPTSAQQLTRHFFTELNEQTQASPSPLTQAQISRIYDQAISQEEKRLQELADASSDSGEKADYLKEIQGLRRMLSDENAKNKSLLEQVEMFNKQNESSAAKSSARAQASIPSPSPSTAVMGPVGGRLNSPLSGPSSSISDRIEAPAAFSAPSVIPASVASVREASERVPGDASMRLVAKSSGIDTPINEVVSVNVKSLEDAKEIKEAIAKQKLPLKFDSDGYALVEVTDENGKTSIVKVKLDGMEDLVLESLSQEQLKELQIVSDKIEKPIRVNYFSRDILLQNLRQIRAPASE
jgi:hypothetical protein